MTTTALAKPQRVLHELTPAEAYIRAMKRLFEKDAAWQQRHQANIAQEAKEIHEQYFGQTTLPENGTAEQQTQG